MLGKEEERRRTREKDKMRGHVGRGKVEKGMRGLQEREKVTREGMTRETGREREEREGEQKTRVYVLMAMQKNCEIQK